MAWFRKGRDEAEDDGPDPHAAPIEIDLGLRTRPWEAEVLVQQWEADGHRVGHAVLP